MNSKQTGILGEKIAQRCLKNKGYQILDKNYSFRISASPQKGEIDIVAKKGDTIHFVEVKTLRQAQGEHFLPEDKVNAQKQRRIIKTAESWLMKNKIPLASKWQIDVVSIIMINSDNKKAKIRHFQNI
jgi:putative endonuclease